MSPRSCTLVAFSLLVFPLLALASTAEARRPPQPPLVYHLHMSNAPTTPYTPNLLLVRVLSEGKATGQVHLQFGIGPQGRAPQPWEGTQRLSFTGTFKGTTSEVSFSVTATTGRGKTVFHFRGYRITQGVDGFAGIYSIGGKEQGGFLALRAPGKAPAGSSGSGTYIDLR